MPKADPHLRLRQIEVFLEAAKLRHFSKAANALGISTATLSQAISDLENSLGATLFDRDARYRGVRLTPRGEALVAPAESLLHVAKEARDAVAAATLKKTKLVLTYQPMLASTARAALEALLRRQPGVHVEALETPLRDIPSLFREGAPIDVEVALAYLQEPSNGAVLGEYERLEGERLSASDLWLVTSAVRRVKLENDRVSLANLLNEPFALLWLKKRPSFLIRDVIRAYFRRHQFRPRNVVFRSNRVSAVLAMVRAGIAVTILPTIDPRERDGLAFYKLAPDPESQLAIGLLWPRHRGRSAAAEAFAREVRARLKREGL